MGGADTKRLATPDMAASITFWDFIGDFNGLLVFSVYFFFNRNPRAAGGWRNLDTLGTKLHQIEGGYRW
jgi:hypothetical protein